MPDIRDTLHALDEADKRLYAQIRTRMRGAYLQALVEVVGIHQHNVHDDAFLDLIDIKVATLFDRGGRFDAATGKLDTKTATEIEADVKDEASTISQGQAVLNSYAGNGQKEAKAVELNDSDAAHKPTMMQQAEAVIKGKPWPSKQDIKQ